MPFTTAQIFQLLAGSIVAIAFFILVYRMPEKRVLSLLIILIPIQLIDSRYGTLNTFITYLVAFAFVLQGRFRVAPLLWSVFILLFAYAISLSLSHPAARVWHVIYMVGFLTNFLLFYLIYNYIHRTSDWRMIFRALFVMNAIVVVACLVEIAVGDSQFRLFGVNEWRIGSVRAYQGRIVGPFGSTHTTADYLVTQCMMIAFWMVYDKSGQIRGLPVLLGLNFVCLVATGDRGGFIEILVGSLLFLYLFRRDIGGLRIVKYSVAGIVIFSVASIAVVQYTEFDRLFERLESTELEGDERPRTVGFRRGARWFQERPISGRGPKLNVSTRNRQIEGIPYLGAHPHNLVLTILVTTGIVGFTAWLIFFAAVLTPLIRASRYKSTDSRMLFGLPKLAMLIILLFMMGEVRIEFLRSEYWDYQNYMFVLFGVFVAAAHQLLRQVETGPVEAFNSAIASRQTRPDASKI